MTAQAEAEIASQILVVLTAAEVASGLLVSDDHQSADAWLEISRLAANKLKLMIGRIQ